jgi:DNA (cytosine-5)-methyltransferase 1
LKACGYRVTCRVCDAQWLGVPQMRQRTIFVGVREDLNLEPCHPKPLPYQYSVRDALPEIGKVVHDTAGAFAVIDTDGKRPSDSITCGSTHHFKVTPMRNKRGGFGKSGPIKNAPSPTVMAGTVGNLEMHEGTDKRKFTIAELKRICAFPDDFVLTGSYAQQWERLGNSVPPVMMMHIASAIRDGVLCKVQPSSPKTRGKK